MLLVALFRDTAAKCWQKAAYDNETQKLFFEYVSLHSKWDKHCEKIVWLESRDLWGVFILPLTWQSTSRFDNHQLTHIKYIQFWFHFIHQNVYVSRETVLLNVFSQFAIRLQASGKIIIILQILKQTKIFKNQFKNFLHTLFSVSDGILASSSHISDKSHVRVYESILF